MESKENEEFYSIADADAQRTYVSVRREKDGSERPDAFMAVMYCAALGWNE